MTYVLGGIAGALIATVAWIAVAAYYAARVWRYF